MFDSRPRGCTQRPSCLNLLVLLSPLYAADQAWAPVKYEDRVYTLEDVVNWYVGRQARNA